MPLCPQHMVIVLTFFHTLFLRVWHTPSLPKCRRPSWSGHVRIALGFFKPNCFLVNEIVSSLDFTVHPSIIKEFILKSLNKIVKYFTYWILSTVSPGSVIVYHTQAVTHFSFCGLHHRLSHWMLMSCPLCLERDGTDSQPIGCVFWIVFRVRVCVCVKAVHRLLMVSSVIIMEFIRQLIAVMWISIFVRHIYDGPKLGLE